MKESTNLAWHCLGNLLSDAAPRTLSMGGLDGKGEQTYSKPKNVAQWFVYDLQMVINEIQPSGPMGLPDGAFGKNTADSLVSVTGSREYQAQRDLPLFVEKFAAHTLGALQQPQAEKPTLRGAVSALLIPEVEHFNQCDPVWAMRKMGADMPFKKGACGICAIAMLFNWIVGRDKRLTPVDLDEWMDNNGGYQKNQDGTPTNILLWGKMLEFAKEVMSKSLSYQQIGSRDKPLEHEEGLEKARDHLYDQGSPIILRVQYRQTTSRQWFNHFVLGIGVNEYGEIRYLDPRNAVGGDLSHPQNDTSQTIIKGGYNIVALERFGKTNVA